MTAIAPALMKGLRGMPCSYSSWTMELNGLPEGSRPTRRHSRSPTLPSASVSVNTFEMLWIENGRVAVAAGRDVAVGVDHGKAEGLAIDARELRNIGRDLAAIRPLPHLVGDVLDDWWRLPLSATVSRSRAPCSKSCTRKGRPLRGALKVAASPRLGRSRRDYAE